MKGYKRLLTKDGYPGQNVGERSTPIRHEHGKNRLEIHFGEYKELTEKELPQREQKLRIATVVTAGDWFYRRYKDEKIRAFDEKNGQRYFGKQDLPAAGHATPVVYAVNAIRGNRLRGKRKAPNPVMLTAFALP
jgi:quinoprotein glucose dehydrogenase